MLYTIRQIRDIERTDYAFRDYDREKFNEDDYKTVWCAEATAVENIYEFLETLFCAFNATADNELPRGYEGHSLSVSDIIVIEEAKNSKDDGLYYCNSFGWKKVR